MLARDAIPNGLSLLLQQHGEAVTISPGVTFTALRQEREISSPEFGWGTETTLYANRSALPSTMPRVGAVFTLADGDTFRVTEIRPGQLPATIRFYGRIETT